jgi:hypothetical protein
VRVVLDPNEFARRRDAGQRQAATRTWQAVAARQLAVYQRARAEPYPNVDLPRSSRPRRALARAEFGATARTPSGFRPFALPLLRRNGVPGRVLGTIIDAGAELAARRWP